MKRYIFIGSINFSAYCLKALLEMGINIVDIMCPHREAARFNADYFDLGKVTREFGREVHYFGKISNEAEHIRIKAPDIIFVFGLSQMIPSNILKIPTLGCIGSHPALLPQNRGRHPITWAIANGLKKSGITLFWLDEGVDSGDILAQKEFTIDDSDDAHTVYEKVQRLYIELLKEHVPQLENGIINRKKQDNSKATCWRKRNYEDGQIDWRMSSKRIYDLVRALTKPYIGAHCIYKGKEVKIWKARVADGIGDISNFEPGKVISRNVLRIQVKTGDGAIEIIEHDFDRLPEKGEYL